MPHDVIIIGAGAAGLAAARALLRTGVDVMTLEAQNRVGGRILTDLDLAPHPVELGAEFVHGEHVPTWELIRAGNLQTKPIFQDPDNFFFRIGNRWLLEKEVSTVDGGESALGAMSLTGNDVNDAIARRRQRGLPDTDVASLLHALTISDQTDLGRIVRGSYEGLNAGDPEELGAYGLADADYAGDGHADFRIDSGYHAWVALLAKDVPVRLATPAVTVRWQTGAVEVVTADGETLHGAHLVVTVPLSLLQRDQPHFVPALPPEKAHALAGLGAGPITKAVLRFGQPCWPERLERAITPGQARFFWRTAWSRSEELPLLTVYTGGSTARALNRLGRTAAVAALVGDLAKVFDLTKLPDVVDSRFVDWAAEPFTGLGYSFARPGGAAAREGLAKPVDDTLFFAGEATNRVRPATVHGAFESGERAAREVLTAMGRG